MGTTRYVLRRSSQAKLSFSQMEELWLGPSHRGSSFESDEHRRAMWVHHREKIMRLWAKGGRRPFGWWRYECPEGLWYPGRDHERSMLYTAGVLTEAEAGELRERWHKEFDRAWSNPHFSYSAGGRILVGAAAREQHCLWADIPPDLYEEWLAEHQRRGRAARELQEESALAPTEAVAEGSA